MVVLKDLDIFKALDNKLLWGGVILFSFFYPQPRNLRRYPYIVGNFYILKQVSRKSKGILEKVSSCTNILCPRLQMTCFPSHSIVTQQQERQ